MKLKCDEPLSNVAFKFNVRRYNEETRLSDEFRMYEFKVGRCRLTVSKPELKGRLVSALDTII